MDAVNLKSELLTLLLESGALKFGSFTTKSGRSSPYFFNFGAIDSGARLQTLGRIYADHIVSSLGNKEHHLYGPAYKGITIAAASSEALSQITKTHTPFTFNRKEHKAHGEGGGFVGRDLKAGSRITIVEDVLTGGTSVRESLQLLAPLNVEVEALVVGVDRQERGAGVDLASRELETKFQIPVFPILRLSEIIDCLWSREFLGKKWIDVQTKKNIDEYSKLYGLESCR